MSSGSLGESFQAKVDRRPGAPPDVLQPTYLRNACVPQLVSARAAAMPNAMAVTHGKLSLTYKELDVRASQLANRLRSLGVGPDAIVALYLNRSLAMVVGALAILKAGGAYLPLDPTYPSRRLAFIMKDAQAPILLTTECMVEEVPLRTQKVVTLDSEGRLAAPASSEPILAQAKAEDLAYVIYTSGSTGQPKGVEITHDSLLNLVFWHQRTFGVKPSDRTTQLANPGFDASVWELWPYLTAGATVFLPDDAIRNDPGSLRDWLVAKRITISFVPTPLAERMIALKWPCDTALRLLLTGADTLHTYPPPHLPFTLINNYGPTECSVVATSGPVPSGGLRNTLPSIGRPIANTQIYILDEQMQQVPVGTVGEIYIGGAGLARGYLNRPELTAERFIHNQFSSDPNSRLYKTGDLARYLTDGQLAFEGRIDEQVKIRGYRIELNEINTVLSCHPMLAATIVLAREDSPGDKRLVAYLVPKPGTVPTDTDLRQFLGQQLPDFMIPAIFIPIPSMPLNANGKIDRGALPAPTEVNILRDQGYAPALTPIEQTMTTMLAKLLHLQKVDPNDNFFLLGGNSLLGAQVIAQVRDTFGVELSLLGLFDHPTAAELSAEVERLLFAKVYTMSEAEAEQLTESFSKETDI